MLKAFRTFKGGFRFKNYAGQALPMIDASIKVLTKKGIHEIHIYYDKF